MPSESLGYWSDVVLTIASATTAHLLSVFMSKSGLAGTLEEVPVCRFLVFLFIAYYTFRFLQWLILLIGDAVREENKLESAVLPTPPIEAQSSDVSGQAADAAGEVYGDAMCAMHSDRAGNELDEQTDVKSALLSGDSVDQMDLTVKEQEMMQAVVLSKPPRGRHLSLRKLCVSAVALCGATAVAWIVMSKVNRQRT